MENVNKVVVGDQEDREEIIINSPIRVREGGALMLEALPKNQHKANKGARVINPLLRNMLRLDDFR